MAAAAGGSDGRCSHCGRAPTRLLKCSRCQNAVYCDTTCQRAAWGSHKAECPRPKPAEKSEAEEAKQSAKAAEANPTSKSAQSSQGTKQLESKSEDPHPPQSAPAPATAAAATAATAAAAAAAAAAAPPPRPQSPVSPLRLVGVLSSHIGSENRLHRLECCLQSVEHQSTQLDAFYIVWSAPPKLEEKVKALFADFQKKLPPTCDLYLLQQTRRTSQFYDIKWLHDELLHKEPLGTWALFTDDDDLWSEHRVARYKAVIEAHRGSPKVTAVCATHKVRPKDRKVVADTAAAVQMQLSSGAASHCGGVHEEEEFFDFACPVSCMKDFFNICNEETLLHPFADLRFTRFLSEYYQGCQVMYFPTDGATSWVYYYSTAYRTPEDEAAFDQFAAQDQASTVVKRRKDDEGEARRTIAELGGPGQHCDEESLEEMIEMVAGLRQNIEAIVIRHFPEDPLGSSELKRIAVGQLQGQTHLAALAQRLARQAAERFGLKVT